MIKLNLKSHILHTISARKKQPRAVRNGFSKEERDTFLKALFTLTNDCLTGFKELTDKDLLSLKLMDNIRQPIEEALDAGGLSTKEMFRSIMILLDAITRYGTPQFTRQARLAFMARAFCRTLVLQDILRTKRWIILQNPLIQYPPSLTMTLKDTL